MRRIRYCWVYEWLRMVVTKSIDIYMRRMRCVQNETSTMYRHLFDVHASVSAVRGVLLSGGNRHYQ